MRQVYRLFIEFKAFCISTFASIEKNAIGLCKEARTEYFNRNYKPHQQNDKKNSTSIIVL